MFPDKAGIGKFLHPALYRRNGPQGWDILETLQKPPDELIRMIEPLEPSSYLVFVFFTVGLAQTRWMVVSIVAI